MDRRFLLLVASMCCHSSASAEAPIYFDLRGLVFAGVGALLLFVFLIVAVVRTKSRGIRLLSLMGLGAYVVVPMLISMNAHRVRERGESWTLFESERYNRSTDSIIFDLCQKAIEQRPQQKIQGFRLLKVESLPDLPARGWRTGADFFVGGTTYPGRDTPATVVQALQNSMRQLSKQTRFEGLDVFPFVEYQLPDGRWKRYEVPVGKLTYVEQDVSDVRASHGLKIAQIKTGTKRQYTIYAGSIEVIDLATGAVVGKHLSYTVDRYWEAHNHHALFAGEHCTGLPLGVDFLTDWLRPLVF